jgi:hypothetical protein
MLKEVLKFLKDLPGKFFFVLLIVLWAFVRIWIGYYNCIFLSILILFLWGLYILVLFLLGKFGKKKKTNLEADQPDIEKVERLEERIIKAAESSKDAPLYLVIGPKESGKTTLLINSGLEFSSIDTLQDTPLQQEIKGETRNCDIFYTKDASFGSSKNAIILDTAGRYVTFGNESREQGEWRELLSILKKYRKPINGLIVAIDLPRLVASEESDIEGQAKMIRDRMMEMIPRFGIKFPVYVVFTKCDSLYGFTEFFDDLEASERAQIWGATFRNEQQENLEAAFREECEQLSQILHDRRLLRLSQGKTQAGNSIYTLPLEFDAVYSKLTQFVTALFEIQSKEKPMFRGFYLTSAAQTGEAVDLVLKDEATSLGHPPLQFPTIPKDQGQAKGYFIKNIFQQVLFPDQGLEQPTTEVERRNMFVRLGICGAALILLALFSAIFFVSYSRSKRLMTNAKLHAAEVYTIPEQSNSVEDFEKLEDFRRLIVQLERRSLLWNGQRDKVADNARKLYLGKIYGSRNGWEARLTREVEVPVKVFKLVGSEKREYRPEPIEEAKVLAQVLNGAVPHKEKDKIHQKSTNENGLTTLKLKVEDGKIEVNLFLDHQEEGWETPQAQTCVIEPGERVTPEIKFIFSKLERLITIHCLDQFGENLSGVPIAIINAEDEELAQETTNPEGKARFDELEAPAGSALRIRYDDSETNFPAEAPDEVKIVSGQREYNLTKQLRRKIKIYVQAITNQQPQIGVLVSVDGKVLGATNDSGQLEGNVDTPPTRENIKVDTDSSIKEIKVNKNDKGEYSIVLKFEPEPVVTSGEGIESSDDDGKIETQPLTQPPPTLDIVTPSGEPISDVEVWVYLEEGESPSFETADEIAYEQLSLQKLRATTDSEGGLELPKEAEKHSLLLYHPDYWPKTVQWEVIENRTQMSLLTEEHSVRDFNMQEAAAKHYYNEAIRVHRDDEWDDAFAAYEKAIRLMPTKKHYFFIAAAYRDAGNKGGMDSDESSQKSHDWARRGIILNLPDEPNSETWHNRLEGLAE